MFVLRHLCARHLKNNFHFARMSRSTDHLLFHTRYILRARRLPIHYCSLHIGLPLLLRCLTDLSNSPVSQITSSTLRFKCAVKSDLSYCLQGGAVLNRLTMSSVKERSDLRRLTSSLFLQERKTSTNPFGIYHPNKETTWIWSLMHSVFG